MSKYTRRPQPVFAKSKLPQGNKPAMKDSKDLEKTTDFTPEQKAKVGRVMEEYEHGKLKTSSGQKVTSRKQAVAIALSEARRSDKNYIHSKYEREVLDRDYRDPPLSAHSSDKDRSEERLQHLRDTKGPHSHVYEDERQKYVKRFGHYPGERSEEERRIEQGALVEREHAATIREAEKKHLSTKEVERKIAEDHLREDPEYYKKLKSIESKRVVKHREPSNEADVRELRLYGNNDAQLYRQMREPIERNLARKKERGEYDHDKAVKAWQNYYDEVAKRHAKEFPEYHTGELGENYTYRMTPASRHEAAEQAAREWEEEYAIGNYAGQVRPSQ